VHLSWEVDPSRSITVTWRTEAVEASIVQYGLDRSYGESGTGTPGIIHTVRLVNLTPSTTYHYRCGNGSSWSAGHTFTTGPGDPASGFSFAAVGDDRGNYGVRRSIALSILGTDAAFAIHTGDLVNDGRDQNNWDQWFESGEELYARVPVMTTMGNHEEMAPQYFDQLALPNNEMWYSFDYGNAHFVALNTETSMYGEQLKWLQQDLSACNSTWKFVFFHRPMYSSGYHGSDHSVRRAWEGVLNKHDVDVAFVGHDHIYERTKPMVDGQAPGNGTGTVHVVTGGGGAGLHDLRPLQPSWSLVRLSEHHYIIVEVREGSLHLEARLPNGLIFDELDIYKEDYPDLQVSSLKTDPRYPSPGDPSSILATIVNLGQSPTGSFTTRITAGGSVHLVPSESLGPGETRILHLGWSPATAGPVEITAEADAWDEINEGLKEGNNDVRVQVSASDPKPDLVVGEFSCDPAPPLPKQPTILRVRAVNEGNLPSNPFDIRVVIEGGPDHTSRMQGLPAGAVAYLEVPWNPEAGDWRASILVDSGSEIEEIDEDNNRVEKWFYVRTLVRTGAAYVPRGLPDDGPAVVYYDAGEGLPAGTSEVIIVWGVDGWVRPPSTLAGPSTLVLSRTFETRMDRFHDDLYVALLRSENETRWIDLRFSNAQLIPDALDDNNGNDWRIRGRPLAEELLSEFVEALSKADSAGGNVSSYRSLLELGNELLASGDHLGVENALLTPTLELRRLEAVSLLGTARREYDEAVAEGVEPGRAGVFLEAAETELEKGNLEGSSRLSLNVLELIEDIRAEIPELALDVLGPVCAVVILFLAGVLAPHVRDTRWWPKNGRTE
jgi:hypothetical protein